MKVDSGEIAVLSLDGANKYVVYDRSLPDEGEHIYPERDTFVAALDDFRAANECSLRRLMDEIVRRAKEDADRAVLADRRENPS